MTQRVGVRGSRAVALILAAALLGVACGTPAGREARSTGGARQASRETPEPTPSAPRLVRTFTTGGSSEGDGDLPVDKLERLSGTNHTSFTWSPDSPEKEVFASSTRFTPTDNITTLFTSGPNDAGRVEAELRNETKDRKLEVKGHIVYRLTGPDGASEHPSEPLDAVLGPGESLVVVFILELPDGDYEASSVFIPQAP